MREPTDRRALWLGALAVVALLSGGTYLRERNALVRKGRAREAGLVPRHAVRALSILCLIIALAQVAASILYLLDESKHPESGGTSSFRPFLETGMLKCGIFAATYVVLYAWHAAYLWRTLRRPPRSVAGGAPGE